MLKVFGVWCGGVKKADRGIRFFCGWCGGLPDEAVEGLGEGEVDAS